MVKHEAFFLQPAFTFPPIPSVSRASTSRNPSASGTDTAVGKREPPLTYSRCCTSRLYCKKNLSYFLDPPTSAIWRARRAHRKLAATQIPRHIHTAPPWGLLLSKAVHNLLEDTCLSSSLSSEAVFQFDWVFSTGITLLGLGCKRWFRWAVGDAFSSSNHLREWTGGHIVAQTPPAISLQSKCQALGWKQNSMSTECSFWAITLLLLPPCWGREVVCRNAVLEGDLYLCGEMHMPWDGAAAL